MIVQAPIALSPKQQSFIAKMRRALIDRRESIEIDDFVFRFARRGETFDDGDFEVTALESGIFVKCPGTSGGERVPGRWLHHGSSDDLEDLMFKRFLVDKSDGDIEAIAIEITAAAVLKELAEDRSARRSNRPR